LVGGCNFLIIYITFWVWCVFQHIFFVILFRIWSTFFNYKWIWSTYHCFSCWPCWSFFSITTFWLWLRSFMYFVFCFILLVNWFKLQLTYCILCFISAWCAFFEFFGVIVMTWLDALLDIFGKVLIMELEYDNVFLNPDKKTES